jgi:hypothetical protein
MEEIEEESQFSNLEEDHGNSSVVGRRKRHVEVPSMDSKTWLCSSFGFE